MDPFLKFIVLLGSVLFLCVGLEAGIFKSALNLVVPKKHIDVTDWHLETCGAGHDGLELQNIHVLNDREEGILVFGKVKAKTFLSAPITAKVSMKRKVLGLWVKVPCIKDFGSCTYEDLCSYGYPDDMSCPASFVQDGVPCRCPIGKGLYNIPSDVKFSADVTRWGRLVKGKYRATVQFLHKNFELACYVTNFTLKIASK